MILDQLRPGRGQAQRYGNGQDVGRRGDAQMGFAACDLAEMFPIREPTVTPANAFVRERSRRALDDEADDRRDEQCRGDEQRPWPEPVDERYHAAKEREAHPEHSERHPSVECADPATLGIDEAGRGELLLD